VRDLFLRWGTGGSGGDDYCNLASGLTGQLINDRDYSVITSGRYYCPLLTISHQGVKTPSHSSRSVEPRRVDRMIFYSSISILWSWLEPQTPSCKMLTSPCRDVYVL